MGDITLTINSTAAPIALGTVTVPAAPIALGTVTVPAAPIALGTVTVPAAPIALGTIGLRLAGIKGDKGDMASISPATATTLGGIKVGSNLAIADGVLSIDTAALTAYVDTVILGGAS